MFKTNDANRITATNALALEAPLARSSADGEKEIALGKHYRVKELAALWGVSANTVIRMFEAESGVLNLSNFNTPGKRRYKVLSIPESVALAVHSRLGQNPFQSSLSAGGPLRVIRLGNFHAGMAKKSGHVLKLHPRQ
jgi:hypothetical protein